MRTRLSVRNQLDKQQGISLADCKNSVQKILLVTEIVKEKYGNVMDKKAYDHIQDIQKNAIKLQGYMQQNRIIA